MAHAQAEGPAGPGLDPGLVELGAVAGMDQEVAEAPDGLVGGPPEERVDVGGDPLDDAVAGVEDDVGDVVDQQFEAAVLLVPVGDVPPGECQVGPDHRGPDVEPADRTPEARGRDGVLVQGQLLAAHHHVGQEGDDPRAAHLGVAIGEPAAHEFLAGRTRLLGRPVVEIGHREVDHVVVTVAHRAEQHPRVEESLDHRPVGEPGRGSATPVPSVQCPRCPRVCIQARPAGSAISRVVRPYLAEGCRASPE